MENSLSQIAKTADVSKDTIRRWMNNHGIPRRSHAEAIQNRYGKRLCRGELEKFYCSQGLNCAEIGDITGKSSSTIRRWLMDYGISIRNQQVHGLSRDILLHLYTDEKMTLEQVALQYNTTTTTIRRHLKKHNIPRRKQGRQPIEIDNLESMYETMTVQAIADKMGICSQVVTNRMNEIGILRDGRHHRKPRQLHPIFEKDSAELYYIAGLVYSDGYSSTKYKTVSITQTRQPAILEQIQRIAGGKLYNDRTKLVLGTIVLAEWFRDRFNIDGAKSKTIEWPDIPKEYTPDFIRGFFDGDGSIQCRRRKRGGWERQLSFTCGSESFVQRLRIMLKYNGLSFGRFYEVHGIGTAYRIMYSSLADLRAARNLMYYAPGVLCMKHKHDIFCEAIIHRGTMSTT